MYSLGVSMDRPILVAAVVAVGAACAVLPGGCVSNKATDRSAAIPAGRYTEAFDAARETLREYKFTLSRVDARSGVITTEPRFSYGIASPFDPVHSTARDRVRDFMNQQDRRVRIVFARPGVEPALEGGSDAGPAGEAVASGEIPADGVLLDGSVLPGLGDDLRAEHGGLVMHVDVVIDRVHVPHWRLETSSIRQSTFAQEPDLSARGMQPTYTTPRERDDAFAARLVADVRRRLSITSEGAPSSGATP